MIGSLVVGILLLVLGFFFAAVGAVLVAAPGMIALYYQLRTPPQQPGQRSLVGRMAAQAAGANTAADLADLAKAVASLIEAFGKLPAGPLLLLVGAGAIAGGSYLLATQPY